MSTSTWFTREHEIHLSEELGEGGLELAKAHGVRSVSAEEAKALGFLLMGPNGEWQSSGGILFPGQLRCDSPLLNRDGDEAKYLSLSGSTHKAEVIGKGEPTLATEGWKDAARLHLATGETVAAIPGVHSWQLLPNSVRLLIYDADAALNPFVWEPLIIAGAERPRLKLAFFDREIAGDKGGACEFFRNGGTLTELRQRKPLALLQHVIKQAHRDLRADWHAPAVRSLIRCTDSLELDLHTCNAMVKQLCRRLGMKTEAAQGIKALTLQKMKLKNAEAEGQNHAEECIQAEPNNTHERCQQLMAVLGPHWQADHSQRDAWRRWNGLHWEEVIGNDPLLAEIESFFDSRNWKNRELQTFRSLQAAFRRNVRSVPPEPVEGLLPFRNGCLRIVDKTFLPHRPENGNTWHLPYDYDPAATCPKILNFLEDRLGDTCSLAVFQAFAWHLLNGRRPKVFIEIVGASNTGKSVLENLLVALVGRSAIEAGTLERLENYNNRFETFRYRGRKLALFSEAHRYSGPLETLKKMTGGDPIDAEKKGSHAAVSFVFYGGVVVVGNGPIRPSDTSGAVINRRRSLYVDKVIPAAQERVMLEPEGMNGWRGELASELPGLAVWALQMREEEARSALARDVNSLVRAETDLKAVLNTDHLAAWADESLIWDPTSQPARIGKLSDPALKFLLPHYREWLKEREDQCTGLGQRNFSLKLISLLRDTLVLPLPAGNPGSGDYRLREVGSVIPQVRLRNASDDPDAPGVIRYAFLARVSQPEQFHGQLEQKRKPTKPLGNGRNERNEQITAESLMGNHEAENTGRYQSACHSVLQTAIDASLSVSSVPSVPLKAPKAATAVPKAPDQMPKTNTEWVADALNSLDLPPEQQNLPRVMECLERNAQAPRIGKRAAAEALARLEKKDSTPLFALLGHAGMT